MKRPMFGILIVFLLVINGLNYQMSGEDEEVPGMSEENIQDLYK